MTKLGLVLVVVASAMSACFLFEGRDTARLEVASTAPVEVRLGCALAETRCTRCHTVDRVLGASIKSVDHWRAYVRRMRLQPQSGILPDEELPILRCLVWRSFGPLGLESIDAGSPR